MAFMRLFLGLNFCQNIYIINTVAPVMWGNYGDVLVVHLWERKLSGFPQASFPAILWIICLSFYAAWIRIYTDHTHTHAYNRSCLLPTVNYFGVHSSKYSIFSIYLPTSVAKI